MKNLTLIILLLLITTSHTVSAATAHIGLSPATILFSNVLRGGYAEKNVIITIDTQDFINSSVEARGDIASWLNYSKSFTVNRQSPYYLKISVTPPTDVPNGNYTGFVRIKTENFANPAGGQNVATVQAALDLVVNVEIIDTEIKSCTSSNFDVKSAEKGDDVIFTADVENQGNTRISPKIHIEIWDQDQINIIKTEDFTPSEIIPTTQNKQLIRIPTKDLDLGQYWAQISVPDCYSSDTLTFDVLEPGALKDNGILMNIMAKVWAEVDETLPITANFKNTGEKEETAQFKGTITLGNKIVQTVETEKLSVLPSDTTNFTFYLTPKEAGKYIVSGRVFYNNKRTFESSTIINVTSKQFDIFSIIMPIIYIILFLIAVFLIVKIRQERKSQRIKLNEIRRLR